MEQKIGIHEYWKQYSQKKNGKINQGIQNRI